VVIVLSRIIIADELQLNYSHHAYINKKHHIALATYFYHFLQVFTMARHGPQRLFPKLADAAACFLLELMSYLCREKVDDMTRNIYLLS